MMLPDTHERALPAHPAQTLEDYLVYLKHIALYDFAKNYCAQKMVLDLGCGEGYGSGALASVARFVVAADYDFQVVVHARAQYACPNTGFVVCDAQHLPFRAATFETVISFEVIEHIPDVPSYLCGIKRVSGAHGVAMISTPNRLLRLLPFQKPWNSFHLREYDARGLLRVTKRVFPQVEMKGVTAIPAIQKIEAQRVKQNPFIAYPKTFARIVLPTMIYDGLRRLKHRLVRRRCERAVTLNDNRFSSADFRVSENGLRESINLIAVCQERKGL